LKLFQSLTIKKLTIRNRIVMPPMATVMDVSTLRARRYYQERAYPSPAPKTKMLALNNLII